MIIVGAGLSGLIAASILRDEVTHIYDAQQSLPNNHSALLRFKTPVVGDAAGIPFRRVKVMKASSPWRNPVADAMSYSKKTNGSYSLRSVTTANGEIEERWIAPHDFIGRLARQSEHKIEYGVTLAEAIERHPGEKIISTVPMPTLIHQLGIDPEFRVDFRSREGYTINADLGEGFDVCATVYLPDPFCQIYRASITERTLILEGSSCDQMEDGALEFKMESLNQAIAALGIDSECFYDPWSQASCSDWQFKVGVNRQKYAKILPIDQSFRRKTIITATEAGIYSLGRFATWRPSLLLDDIVNDVRVIQRMAHGDNEPGYKERKQ